jgi:hypothetical protein
MLPLNIVVETFVVVLVDITVELAADVIIVGFFSSIMPSKIFLYINFVIY